MHLPFAINLLKRLKHRTTLILGKPCQARIFQFLNHVQDGPTGGAGAKFQILAQILQLGYAVLLTDMDVVTVRNPFQHLQRDADVEAASDGFSNATAYGELHLAAQPTLSEGYTRRLQKPCLCKASLLVSAGHLTLRPAMLFLLSNLHMCVMPPMLQASRVHGFVDSRALKAQGTAAVSMGVGPLRMVHLGCFKLHGSFCRIPLIQSVTYEADSQPTIVRSSTAGGERETRSWA